MIPTRLGARPAVECWSVSQWNGLVGYDVFITRAPDEVYSEQYPIAPDEWLRIVAEDPELRLAAEVPDLPYCYKGPHFAIWISSPSNEIDWLDWLNHKVYAKNPEPPLIDKMIQIAQKLRARVVGEDDREFRSGEDLPQERRWTP